MTQRNLCLEAEKQLEVRVPRAFKMMLDARVQAPTCCPGMGSFQMSVSSRYFQQWESKL